MIDRILRDCSELAQHGIGSIAIMSNDPADHNARRELFEAMTTVAKTGHGPAEQIASMGCSIKWKPQHFRIHGPWQNGLMKIYHFWHREVVEIRIGGEPAKITAYGRSDVGLEEARSDALERARRLERKIAGEPFSGEGYTADIREEITQEIDAHNVVTRNRYGARVLNSESVIIIDIDHHRRTFLEALGIGKRDNKTAIIQDLGKVAARPEYAALGFRIYETLMGVRLIVTGAYYDPASEQGRALLSLTHADPVFAKLCVKQRCYRARLTPKPGRIKQRKISYRWPMEPDELELAKAWVNEYEAASLNFATCKFVKSIGKEHFSSEIISLHDDETRARSRLPLA